ncbi:DUF1360 domain-containing protein [Paenactinomyces guangxiensis]|uniref:DUF1360 domain-containing protein n=1 Tax=Paenactinomyces guangxiensis TaxID=1490290 RepID=A0A7W1WU04_9BACL|nr:DUF1360 domain-containing protein [Paenactinomyces guangxiensis]MBA4496041.1 DUF1360 domain-containing protein [Paenactinomyces guangxiensis]MBH8593129.1 DUF1360 domain-containing protein [Paenactinomyces guangxiensis]
MFEISWLHFAILALASFRLTHLLMYDHIASFIRAPFLSVTFKEDEEGKTIQNIKIKGTGLRYWIGTLFSCHWCLGVWSSLAVVALYSLLPGSFPLLVILAVAGAAAIIRTLL